MRKAIWIAIFTVTIAFTGCLGIVPLVEDSGVNTTSHGLQFSAVSASGGIPYTTTGNTPGNGDGGAAVADVNGDKWPDVLAVGGDRPVLFENQRGDFVRSNRLPNRSYPDLKSALFVDGDTDGDPDTLLVPRTGTPIYLENVNGSFSERDVGFDTTLDWGTGATAADYNGDGCPDVYLVQNGNWTSTFPTDGEKHGRGLNGNPNLLYQGTCSGFTRANASTGGHHWSTAASFTDLTGDGRADIHVANDYYYDLLYVNQGNGSFAARRLSHTARHAMASEIADLTGDGVSDIFVTNVEFDNPDVVWEMQSGAPMRNIGNNLLAREANTSTYTDRAAALGVKQGGWGWAAEAADFDNDGDNDLIHATKYYVKVNAENYYQDVRTRPAVWEHTDDGFTRRNASTAGFVTTNGRGLVTLDYDRDGRLDVLVADTSGTYRLYRNTGPTNAWLEVRPHQTGATALGATVTVVTNETNTTKRYSTRADLLSQSSRTLHFGLGDTARVEVVRVTWPDGTTTVRQNVSVNQRLVVTKSNGTAT